MGGIRDDRHAAARRTADRDAPASHHGRALETRRRVPMSGGPESSRPNATMSESRPSRSESIRRQGLAESGLAVLTAVMLATGGASSPTMVALIGAGAAWMALSGRRRVERSAPLDERERRELERLAAGSRHVRDLLDLLGRSGQQPVRFDLDRCRRLARLESMLDGRT